MCLYPKLIKNRKYIPNKKNAGNVPKPTDERVLFVPVGCGKCIECRKAKAREWNVRLHEEIRSNKMTAYFVTLSYSNESLNELGNDLLTKVEGYALDNAIAKLSIRRFLERWRKEYNKSIRHWLISELGQNNTERLHIHGILWTDKPVKSIEKIWKYGNVWIGDYVNEKTINYIVKYLSKQDDKHKHYKPVILCSKGIGKGYLNRNDWKKNTFNGRETNETYTLRNGTKLPLPIYYRNYIYDEDDREDLWLYKLDEEVRYVLGQKIDVSKGDEAYINYRDSARKKNSLLGYGNDKTNYDEKEYENSLRNIKKLQRLANAKNRNHIN